MQYMMYSRMARREDPLAYRCRMQGVRDKRSRSKQMKSKLVAAKMPEVHVGVVSSDDQDQLSFPLSNGLVVRQSLVESLNLLY